MNLKNSKGRVTLRDLAHATGLSATAVSRALRGMPDISAETAERIRKTAKEMGYVANQSAVSLRYGRSNIIAVVLPNLTNPFFSIMATKIQLAAQEKGYLVNFLCSHGTPGLDLQMVRRGLSHHTDGFLLFPTDESAESIELLQETHTPFVLLAHDFLPYEADCVAIDDERAAFLSTEHLILSGGKFPAFISASGTSPCFPERKTGFVRACTQYGLSAAADNIYILPELLNLMENREASQAAIAQALQMLIKKNIDSLFVFCDAEAWSIMEVLRLPGFSLHSFQISSIDNIAGNLLYPIPLCSADCGMETIARTGVEILLNRIHGDTSPFRTIHAPVHMICNGSCGCLPA